MGEVEKTTRSLVCLVTDVISNKPEHMDVSRNAEKCSQSAFRLFIPAELDDSALFFVVADVSILDKVVHKQCAALVLP